VRPSGYTGPFPFRSRWTISPAPNFILLLEVRPPRSQSVRQFDLNSASSNKKGERSASASMEEEEARQREKTSKKARKAKRKNFEQSDGAVDTSNEKKKMKTKRKEKEKPTVSIAVAGSIIDNAQSLELATLVSAIT
jgi:hypothetical protein